MQNTNIFTLLAPFICEWDMCRLPNLSLTDYTCIADNTPMTAQLTISDNFRSTVVTTWPKKGSEWLKRLPSIISALEQLWNIRVQEPLKSLSYNFLAHAVMSNGDPVVIKVGCSEIGRIREATALETFTPCKTVAVLEKSEHFNAFLMERVFPGTPLLDLQQKNDAAAVEHAAGCIRDLVTPVPNQHKFQSLTDWASILTSQSPKNVIPGDFIRDAFRMYKTLQSSQQRTCLIHGDLHFENILFDQNKGWIAIDPKGIIADPSYNAARILRNPYNDLTEARNLKNILQRRVTILSNVLEESAYRIAGWGYVDAIIGASWHCNSGTSPKVPLKYAAILWEILKGSKRNSI